MLQHKSHTSSPGLNSSGGNLDLSSYLSRLHPIFNITLLEKYHDPSKFHPHTNLEPFTIDRLPPWIHSITESHKIRHHFEYFVCWQGLPIEESAWTPLSDIPTMADDIIKKFHHQHPKSLRPHSSVLAKHFSPLIKPLPYIALPDTPLPSLPFAIEALSRPPAPPPVHCNP